MKITHPVKGYNGHVRAGNGPGLHFLAGVAHAKADRFSKPVRKQLEDAGFEFVDERRQNDDE